MLLVTGATQTRRCIIQEILRSAVAMSVLRFQGLSLLIPLPVNWEALRAALCSVVTKAPDFHIPTLSHCIHDLRTGWRRGGGL